MSGGNAYGLHPGDGSSIPRTFLWQREHPQAGGGTHHKGRERHRLPASSPSPCLSLLCSLPGNAVTRWR